MKFTAKHEKTGKLIIVRHGQSEANQDNVFAGWLDTPLTEHGKVQAREAGRLMNGFNPDVVYATELWRSEQTAKEALKAMGMPHKDIVIASAMNERHYGNLTGMDKATAKETFGDALFLQYRRSFDEPPPPMDTNNPHHPENLQSDAPKVIALPPNGKGTESLFDVVQRVKPFWEEELLPRLEKGENIAIFAHGNSLRALSMIIEGMTKEEVKDYEIDNAKPIQYNIKASPEKEGWEITSKEMLSEQNLKRAM